MTLAQIWGEHVCIKDVNSVMKKETIAEGQSKIPR